MFDNNGKGVLASERELAAQRTWVPNNVSAGVQITGDRQAFAQCSIHLPDGLSWCPTDLLSPINNHTLAHTKSLFRNGLFSKPAGTPPPF
jgi:hypothetical protein